LKPLHAIGDGRLDGTRGEVMILEVPITFCP